VRAIVVGASGVTRELVGRLGSVWQVTVVDPDRPSLERARQAGAAAAVAGDGSSRVTLGRAGLAEADAVVAATRDDEVNLEVCRLARQAGCLRVVALAVKPQRLADYRRLGVEVHLLALGARELDALLEPDGVSSTTLSGGRLEAVELRVGAGSPVRGRSLAEIGSVPWLVASILRGDQLIVPHGDSVLEEGDVVTVVGGAADYPKIVHAFLATEARFPLEWGKGVAVTLDRSSDLPVVYEALALVRHSGAMTAVVVHRSVEAARDEAHAAEIAAARVATERAADNVEVEWCPVAGTPGRSLGSVVNDWSIGVVVLPTPGRGPLGGLRSRRLLRRGSRLGRPALFALGAGPYQRVAVAPGVAAGSRAASVAAGLAEAFRVGPPAGGWLGGGRGEHDAAAQLVVLGYPASGSRRSANRAAASLFSQGAGSLLLIPEA
jgi:Trk K+ transport system NAD-binding subunit